MKPIPVTRVLLIAALVVVAVGLMVAIVSASQPTTFGWFAYAPLSGEVFSPNGAPFLTSNTALGLAIAAVGLMIGAFWAGLTVGQRRGDQRRPTS